MLLNLKRSLVDYFFAGDIQRESRNISNRQRELFFRQGLFER